MNAFIRSDQRYEPDNAQQAHQIHLNVERIRVPETWFDPGMAGVDSAGLAEVAGWLLNGFTEQERQRMVKVSKVRNLVIYTWSHPLTRETFAHSQCIYVTGGASQIPGLIPRLQSELVSLLPFKDPLRIVTDYPASPELAAWRGMAAWSTTEEARRAAVTRQEWLEYGPGYLKEHRWSNRADV